MKSPKVSIVCISYNHQDFISEAIDSFLAQKTDFDVEIIVADDASSDRTAQIIRSYGDNHSNIRAILRKENIGVQDNLLDAMSLANGTYIALCEGDDFWTDRNKLQQQVDFMDTHKDFSVCFHRVEVFFEKDVTNNYLSPSKVDINKNQTVDILQLLSNNVIPTNSVLYRNAYEYKKLNNKVMPLDWYLHAYHATKGKIYFIDKVMGKNRRHENGVWWAVQQDPNVVWTKYSNGWIELFSEFLNLFGSNDQYFRTIKINLLDFFEAQLRFYKINEFSELSKKIIKKNSLKNVFIEWSIDRLPVVEHEVKKIVDHMDGQLRIVESQHEDIERLKKEIDELQNSWWYKLKSKLKI